jgi:hypothetical protein
MAPPPHVDLGQAPSAREALLLQVGVAYRRCMADEGVSQAELARRILTAAELPVAGFEKLAALGGGSRTRQLPRPDRFTVLIDHLFSSPAERAQLQRLYWQLVDDLPPGSRVTMGIEPQRPAGVCRNCGGPCAPHRTFCSRTCKTVASRSPVENDSPLIRFLVEEESRAGLSRRGFALTIGLDPHCYYGLLRIRGQLPTEATLAVLKAYFGERLPHTPTETERRRRKARENLQLYAPARGTTAARDHGRRAAARSAERRRGQAMPEVTRAKIGAKRRATLAEAGRTGDRLRLRDYMRSPEGRAVASLTRLLEWSTAETRRRSGPRPLPQTLAEAPSRRQWRDHAARVGSRLGLTQGEVLELWTPRLEQLGLWSTRGRKPLLQRYEIVSKFRDSWPTGRRGLWPAALQHLIETVGRPGAPADGEALRKWFMNLQRLERGPRTVGPGSAKPEKIPPEAARDADNSN